MPWAGALWRKGVALLLAAGAGLVAMPAQADCVGYGYLRPRFMTIAENVVIAPAQQRVRRVDPVVREVTDRVLVQPERRIPITVPAVYRTVTERIVVKPGTSVTRYIPPIEDVTRPTASGAKSGRVQLRAALAIVDTTPPTYALRARKILAQPARTKVRIVSAVYATRTRRVEVSPARVVTDTTPARYRTVERRVLVRPGIGPFLAQGPQYCAYAPRLVVPAPVVVYYPAVWWAGPVY